MTNKSNVKILVSNLFILLILICIGEIALKTLLPNGEIALRVRMNKLARRPKQSNTKGKIFDTSRFRFYPNIKIPKKHSEYSYFASINSDGWRVPCLNKLEKVDLFLIGDSFVFGTGVEDSDTFSCASNNLGINLYTLGVPGFAPSDYLKIINKNKDLIQIRGKKNLSLNSRPKIMIAIFTGNDYEDLLDTSKYQVRSITEYYPSNKISKTVENTSDISFLKSFVSYFNYQVVRKNILGLGDSYILNGIKILLRKNLYDGENFYRFYDGSTFYTKNAEPDTYVIIESLKLIKSFLYSSGFSLDGFLLIPSPGELSKKRFERDSTLRGIKTRMNNVNRLHKFDSILSACTSLSIKCIDTRKILEEKDYYIHDNHLNKKGVKKIVNYLFQ